MLTEAFTHLSPDLNTRYQALLSRELEPSPELADLHQRHLTYALRDTHLPRPVLAYFGYHAFSDVVDFTDLDHVGEGLFLPQLLRDVLAIHDDIVDEDTEKFGESPLPVMLSSADGHATELTRQGKDLALYYGDFLVGVMLRLVANIRPVSTSVQVNRLLADTLYVNQRGQLAELLTEAGPPADTSLEDLLLIGERKAAYYCYVFPFALGGVLAGHGDRLDEACQLLAQIGTASQVIDDITGAFPGLVDDDKDTLGEIVHLRRTVPLVLLAHQTLDQATQKLLDSPAPLTKAQADQLRERLWHSSVPSSALELSERLLEQINHRMASIQLGDAATQYLHDLIQHRLSASIHRLRHALG